MRPTSPRSDAHASGGFRYDATAVAEVRSALERQIELLRSGGSGTPAALQAAAQGLFPAEPFGRWRAALHLRSMQEAALSGAVAIQHALAVNLNAFVLKVGRTYQSYQYSEEASAATILRVGVDLRWPGGIDAQQAEVSGLTVVRPGRSTAGALWIPAPLSRSDAELADLGELVTEVRRLVSIRAWEAHYHLSQVYRAAGDFHEVLGDRIGDAGDDLAAAWSSASGAAVVAERELRRVHATVRGHEIDLRTLGAASNATGEALEVLGRWPAYSGRQVVLLATEVNVRFLEIMHQYPRALRFDLPYGQPAHGTVAAARPTPVRGLLPGAGGHGDQDPEPAGAAHRNVDRAGVVGPAGAADHLLDVPPWLDEVAPLPAPVTFWLPDPGGLDGLGPSGVIGEDWSEPE